jgi:hypothetical protein
VKRKKGPRAGPFSRTRGVPAPRHVAEGYRLPGPPPCGAPLFLLSDRRVGAAISTGLPPRPQRNRVMAGAVKIPACPPATPLFSKCLLISRECDTGITNPLGVFARFFAVCDRAHGARSSVPGRVLRGVVPGKSEPASGILRPQPNWPETVGRPSGAQIQRRSLLQEP